MKRNWELDELIEHWTLLPDEIKLLGNKTGATRLGFAIVLKYFQLFVHFPVQKPDVPNIVITHIASQVNVSPQDYQKYDWQSRMAMYHRSQIREFLGFRKAKVSDARAVVEWLIEKVLVTEASLEHLHEIVKGQFLSLKIEPPTNGRIERLIRSALRTFETNFFESIRQKLSAETCINIDKLLDTSATEEEEQSTVKISLFRYLNSDPGKASLDSLFSEISKLEQLRQIGLPENLFAHISPKVLQTYKMRAATEPPRELRWHPEPIRYTLVSTFCWLRTQEVTDNLVDLLISIVHRIGTKAERRVDAQLMKDFKQVGGKHNLLYRMANASLETPEGTVKEVIYPVVSEQTLKDLVKEFKANGTAYRHQVHTVIRSSYSRHYRRLVPKLLEILEFRSNNDVHRPVIQALELLKKYANSNKRFYGEEEQIPIEGVLKTGWQEILMEKDSKGTERINRINYEISVLQALRERLRCKEIWVVGANRYRNPEEDLPVDFEQQRETYYQSLKQPTDVENFILPLQQEMELALKTLNNGLPQNPHLKILSKNQGWIRLSPLKKQPEPVNILRLKTELIRRWPMTSLLDILKEADLRIGFTECFQSLATREALDSDTIQKRLLLCLYGLGTNTGLKRVSDGTSNLNDYDLRYIKRRFIHKEQLRNAIGEVVNAIFRVRSPQIWGEGTTTCASDSKKFGATNQNLMTEWHIRYGGRGVMIYWHVEKKSTCIYSQLKTCSSSEVAAMIEGVLRHDTEMTVQKNFVDSHGQSEVAFAFCHLLGFQLMPRLKGIHSQKLYRPEGVSKDVYPHVKLVLTRSINWDLIRQQYEQMIKYATALRLGTAEPEAILRRFTRESVKHPTYQALAELGKVLKTIFLCQYLHSEALRCEINEGLNVVENWNSANGFIFYGKSGEFSSNQRSEQELVMLSLHLLQVCLVYINTLMLQQVLGTQTWRERLTSEDQRALSPLIYGHVNPYGTFRLDMSQRLQIEQEVA